MSLARITWIANAMRGTLALTLALTLAACDSSGILPSDPSPVGGLTLTAGAKPATIPAGTSGTISVKLRNVSNSSKTINLATGCASLIRVFRSPGDDPVSVGGACAAVVVSVTLAPNEEYTQQLNVGSGTVTQPGNVLAPGEYVVMGDAEHSDIPTLRSTPVRFTVQ